MVWDMTWWKNVDPVSLRRASSSERYGWVTVALPHPLLLPDFFVPGPLMYAAISVISSSFKWTRISSGGFVRRSCSSETTLLIEVTERAFVDQVQYHIINEKRQCRQWNEPHEKVRPWRRWRKERGLVRECHFFNILAILSSSMEEEKRQLVEKDVVEIETYHEEQKVARKQVRVDWGEWTSAGRENQREKGPMVPQSSPNLPPSFIPQPDVLTHLCIHSRIAISHYHLFSWSWYPSWFVVGLGGSIFACLPTKILISRV